MIKSYKDALLEMQNKTEDFQQSVVTNILTACTYNGHYEEYHEIPVALHRGDQLEHWPDLGIACVPVIGDVV